MQTNMQQYTVQYNSIESKGGVIHADFHPQSLGLKMNHFKNGKKDTAHQSFNGKTSRWTTTDVSYIAHFLSFKSYLKPISNSGQEWYFLGV